MILEASVGLGVLRHVFTPAASPRCHLGCPTGDKKFVWQRYSYASWIQQTLTRPLYTPLPGPVHVCLKGSQLHIQGAIMQETEITMLTSAWDQLDRSWRTPHRWHTEFLASFNNCPALDVAIRPSMVANRSCAEGSRKEHGYKGQYTYGRMLKWEVIETTASVSDPSLKVRPSDMFANLYGACYGRRLALLSDGRTAILPAGAKQSDKIAVLRDGHALYVPRPLHGRDEYQFIGAGFVDGWINGEIVEEVGEDKLQTDHNSDPITRVSVRSCDVDIQSCKRFDVCLLLPNTW
ncbi:hypothetical protein BU25DRAFT_211194 [Macroventuria anomochaeta]|uniref:Uncharacterized protein n=1 Tax=Macroventuria anomochaeta TaxID=301207 RepID=A0ACB6RKX1_9PLEO|nr:uncharacterized protein BU25DRAFT_211194 [Macroventuria anomochaeta]KAF2622352.1 hypothetical protein BU25DRAFT_211194 [Macroventuria anomochaeta]